MEKTFKTITINSRRVLEIIALAIVYFLTARLGQLLAIPPGNITPVWLPSGIILAIIMLRGYYLWPGIWIGAFAGNIWAYLDVTSISTMGPAIAAGISNGSGDALGTVVAAYLIKRTAGTTNPFDKAEHVLSFIVFGVLLSSLISAIFGVTSLSLTGFISWDDFYVVFLTWTIGDAVGVMILAPLILLFRDWQQSDNLQSNRLEISAFVVSLCFAAWFYINIIDKQLIQLPLISLLPLLIWPVFRFHQYITFLALLFTATVTIVSTVYGIGAFTGNELNASLLEAQLFLAIVVFTIFILSASVKERKTVNLQMQQHQHQLEELVIKRTESLGKTESSLREEIKQRKKALQDLEIKENSYKSLIELSPSAIVVHRHGKVLFVNEAAMRLLGADTADQMVGHKVLDFVHPDYIEMVTNRIAHIDERPPLIEQKFLRVDGGVIDVEVIGENLDYQGEIAAQVIITDISQRKLLEAKLHQAKKMEAVGLLTGGIAHEFNNLLTPILGYTNLFLKKQNLDEKSKNWLKQIKTSGDRAKVLVDQMLAYGQKSMSIKKPVALELIIEDIINQLSDCIPANIKINKDVSVNLPPVFGMHKELEQIILNLCQNGIDAMPDGGILSISLNLHSSEEGNQDNIQINSQINSLVNNQFIELVIKDSGIGIDSDNMEFIFDPFYSTKEIGQGSGLGLSVAQGIVKQHNGIINIDSNSGKGSSFQLLFPVMDSEENQS